MRICEATLESISPYSQARYHEVPLLEKEQKDDYERRTWRSKLHVDDGGEVYIPAMAFKNAMSEIAKFLSIQIPGKGKSTYTKHFEAGVMVLDGVSLGIKAEEVEGEWFHVPSDGIRGGNKRVKKCFPVIRRWKGKVKFFITDDTITPEVFEKHLKEAGQFIGLGRFRPRNNGFYGRFKVNNTEWLTA